MRCDDALALLSEAADAPLTAAEADALTAHVTGCRDCAAFARHLEQIRRELRYETVEDVPDVAPAVVAAVAGGRRSRPWLQVAAAFGVGLLAGAAFVGLGVREPSHVAVADLPGRVLAAQTSVQSLTAAVTVIERGWHPDVDERTYRGTLAYRAPESLVLDLSDETTYPGPGWVANHVTAVVDGDRWWARGPAPCPRAALPACASPEPRVRSIAARPPFDEAAPAPLDLIVPVRSFVPGDPPRPLGTRRIDGREALGVAVTAAQIAPLLDGLHQAGHWRDVHPADRAEVWLDREALVPLEVRILPSAGSDRALWAARHGHDDPPDTPLLEIRLQAVALNQPVPAGQLPPAPSGAVTRDAGFRDAPAGVVGIEPGWLPDGMQHHRSGALGGGGPRVEVATWSDGRAWVQVRRTDEWGGGRLFGDLGEAVRPVTLEGAGVAYVGRGGRRVGVHGRDVEVAVWGSLPEEDLLRVAAGLGITGEPVPPDWAEADTVDLADLRRALLPPPLAGFAPPAVRRDGDTVTVAFAGPGERAFVLTQGPGDRLPPPMSPEAQGVEVRGIPGRHTPPLGELEWVEDGRVISLRSATLSVAELLALAESLEAR